MNEQGTGKHTRWWPHSEDEERPHPEMERPSYQEQPGKAIIAAIIGLGLIIAGVIIGLTLLGVQSTVGHGGLL